MTWKLAACPACGGDLLWSEEEQGYVCLMCGRVQYTDSVESPTRLPSPAGMARGTYRLRAPKPATDYWVPPADLEPVADLPPNQATTVGYRADGRRKNGRGWH